MMTGVIDSKGNFIRLPFFEINGLCKEIVKTAIEKSEEYKRKFEEYQKNITRFSPEFEFCIHELGWCLYDPFCVGESEILFSNDGMSCIATITADKEKAFDRQSINFKEIKWPILTDYNIKYDATLQNEKVYQEGIIDEKGFVSSTFISNLDLLAAIELMFQMMENREVYLDYLRSFDEYSTKLEYVTSKKNVISIKQIEEGTYALQFVSDNDGKVGNFIDRLEQEGKITELVPILKSENTNIIKAA